MARTEPTFVVAGGQRCGSTWLYRLLDSHPDVFMAKPVRPEPKFFLEDPCPGRDVDWYMDRWFADARGARAVGEKSTSYMETTGAAGRMARAFPRLKVLFVLRHPVERAISNYRFSRENGLESEPFAAAVEREEQRLQETSFPELSAHPYAYVRRGRYADFLEEFDQHFEPDRIRIALYEDLVRDARGVCADLFAFLGVDPAAAELPGAQREVAVESDFSLSRRTLELLLERFAEPNRRLAARLGRDLRHWNAPSPDVEKLLSD